MNQYHPTDPLELQLAAMFVASLSAIVNSSIEDFADVYIALLPAEVHLYDGGRRSLVLRIVYEGGAVLEGQFACMDGGQAPRLRRMFITWRDKRGWARELSLRSSQIHRLEALEGDELRRYVRRLGRTVVHEPRPSEMGTESEVSHA